MRERRGSESEAGERGVGVWLVVGVAAGWWGGGVRGGGVGVVSCHLFVVVERARRVGCR